MTIQEIQDAMAQVKRVIQQVIGGRAFVITAALIFTIVVVGIAAGYRVNVSASLPVGLYATSHVPPTLTRGLLVIVHVEGWSAPGLPFLKPVAALAGEYVCRAGHHLMIHGADYGSVHTEWQGQTLPSAVPEGGCVMIPQGSVFLASTVPQSKDSRYFGPVAIETITAMASPVFTWEASR